MSGYTPVFQSVFTGTLHGKWPDTGLWLCVLALSDKHGVVDVTPQYIASVTGLPVESVAECMARFCEPDPYSRTPDNDGRRLELADPPRTWGWRIVNHSKYRERARLQAQTAAQVKDGRNTEKCRRYRERKSGNDTARHPATPTDTLSNANANTNTEKKKPTADKRPSESPEFAQIRALYPKRAGGNPWDRAAKAISARLAEGATWDQLIAGTRRYAEFCEATDRARTTFVQQAATFFGPSRSYLEDWNPPPSRAEQRMAAHLDSAAEFMRRTEAS